MSDTINVADPVVAELLAARADWIEARQARLNKDCHVNRVLEAAALADMDAMLELYYECRGDCE
jgi:hypothetical protein